MLTKFFLATNVAESESRRFLRGDRVRVEKRVLAA